MRKLAILGILALLAKSASAAGGTANLTVSSGTYQAISLYSNDDGGSRQAIIIGNRTSSDTVNVNNVQGLQVYLGTSTLTTTNGVKVEPGLSAIPIISTNSLTAVVNAGTSAIPIVSTNTLNIKIADVGATGVPIVSSNTLNMKIADVGATGVPIVSTNTLNIKIADVGATGVPIVSTNTLNVSATGTVTVLPGASNIVISATSTIPVSGSLSVNNPSTGTINSAVPGYATYVGGNGVTGNLAGFRVDSSSYLYVNVAAGGASGGTSSNFGASYPGPGTAAGFINTTSGLMQAARVDASSTVVVTPGTVAFPIVSTNTLNIKIADVGATGVPIVSTNTLNIKIADVGATGVPIVSTNTLNIKISDVGATGVPVVSTNTQVQGMTASGSANANNPVKIGVVASSNTPSGFSEGVAGQVADLRGTRMGNLVATLDCPREQIVKSSITIAASTANTVILSSGAAGVYNDMIGLLINNTSATASRIDFRNSNPNGGTIEFAVYVPAGETRGFMNGHVWPGSNAATNWEATSSSSVTDIRIYGLFCRQK